MKRDELLKVSKPILFNTDMVRAIQDNRKTVTRRLIKPRFRENEHDFFTATIEGRLFLCYSDEDDEETRRVKAPYQKGNILYVRETWADLETVYGHLYYAYKADDDTLHHSIGENFTHWHPSIHMPKEAARIFLRVTDVRVERLQNMTVDDCLKEGATAIPPPICSGEISFPKGFELLIEEKQKDWIESAARARYIGWCDFVDKLFRAMHIIWDSTIKKSDLDEYGWNANPWVWVVEFERISKEEALKNENL